MPYQKPAGLSHAANRKRIAYLQETGQGGYVPAGPVQERIRYLKDRRGITLLTIAERADVDKRMIKAHYLGYFYKDVPLDQCFWRTEQAILTARFTAADGHSVPPDGGRRRLQALAAAGYPQKFLGDQLGWSTARVCAIAKGRQGLTFLTVEVDQKITRVYEKYEMSPPGDHGIAASTIVRALGYARKNGYAPAHCWDSDTIDDPDAIPEWTGACGTAEGLRIHQREGIPACPPCLAVNLGPAAGALSLNPAKLKAAREARGLSHQDVGDILGVHNSTVHYWETGRSAPRSRTITDRYLAVLDLDPEDAT